MPGPVKIEKITLAGFRAFLNEQSISLVEGRQPKSLAVFAPNAKGKSSLVDAVEFFFSEEGTLARLGERRSALQAGREALIHVKAEEVRIEPAVSIAFQSPDGPFDGRRLVTTGAQARPEAAERILNARKLDFIIRGSRLRYFVEQQSPSDRYTEVSDWFGMSALLDIQTNLRAVRFGIKQNLDADAATKERLTDLKRATEDAVSQWSEAEVLAWVNEHCLKPLDPKVILQALDKAHPSYVTVKERKEAEEHETGLAQLKQVLTALRKVYDKDSESKAETGTVPEIETAAARLAAAEQAEADERTRSANNIFKTVWEAVQPLLENADEPLNNCPVCDTPFESTAKGSREAVAQHVATHLDSLASYRAAYDALHKAQGELTQKVGSARTGLSGLVAALEAAGYAGQMKDIADYTSQMDGWQSGQDLPANATLKAVILAFIPQVENAKNRKEQQQGEHTWINALAKIDELIGIKNRLHNVQLVRAELLKSHNALMQQETFISGRMKTYSQKIINKLRRRVNEIFRAVHPQEEQAPEIKLELDPEGRRSQLNLLFDFAANRRGVAPSGYLSDSQVHTLALSLRLAAIEMFNKDVPLIILDDVVTSYDADHRRAIAGLLADQFVDHQIIVVTHDERFFHYLREQLPAGKWLFKRITSLDPAYGPKFHGHNIGDSVIETLHSDGESAANEMRQAEEEWLTQIGRDFGVDARIREVHQAFSYNRPELAEALMRFLKSRGLEEPLVKGVANRFLTTLQSGQIENFGSHFQDNPQGFGSVGDEITRWNEFKAFRDSFHCTRCGGKRFKRPVELKKPVCRKGTCETPFAFDASAQHNGE